MGAISSNVLDFEKAGEQVLRCGEGCEWMNLSKGILAIWILLASEPLTQHSYRTFRERQLRHGGNYGIKWESFDQSWVLFRPMEFGEVEYVSCELC